MPIALHSYKTLKEDYDGYKLYCKKFGNFFNTMQQILPENSLQSSRNRQISEMISLSYDVNDHVYLKSKFSQVRTDFSQYRS